MKIKYIQDHIGQHAKAGQEAEVSDSIGKHLIRFGYAEESGLQQPTEAAKEVPADDQLKDGTHKPKGNAGSRQAGA